MAASFPALAWKFVPEPVVDQHQVVSIPDEWNIGLHRRALHVAAEPLNYHLPLLGRGVRQEYFGRQCNEAVTDDGDVERAVLEPMEIGCVHGRRTLRPQPPRRWLRVGRDA